MTEPTYTLEELAEAFDLTPRTARHYIENILPPHHKKGRGKLARYGRDTWNCFAFIQKARQERLTSQQMARVLAELSQDQIDLVAGGLEDLTIVPTTTGLYSMDEAPSTRMASASRRVGNYMPDELSLSKSEELSMLQEEPAAKRKTEIARESKYRESAEVKMSIAPDMDFSASQPLSGPSWRVLYSDDKLQITHRGEADREQREQVRLAARLIKRILKS
jgi:DNA-binding transcriptional MerR regulator